MEILVRTLLLGIVSGSVYALASTGLVLTYKTSGVLNFGYGALAVFTTYVHWQFTELGLPVWTSAAIVILVIAPLIGLFLDTQLFRRIEGQPQVITVIATVGLFVLLTGVSLWIWNGETKFVPALFPVRSIGLPGGANIGTDQLGVLFVAALAAGLLGAMLRYTKIGVAFRAVVNNRPVAGLMGINTNRVSGIAWALGTAFAALVGILLTQGDLLDPNFLPPFIIAFVFGAAVVGYLRSLPLAYLGGIILGIAQALIIQYGGSQGIPGKLKDGLPFLMVTGALLFAPRALRSSGMGASFVVRTRELTSRSTPFARTAVGVTTFAALALVPMLVGGSASWIIQLFNGITYAIVFLSLVILTGYSGQISLGHTAFMGIAAFTAAHLVSGLGLSMWIAMPLGALAAVPAGALVGLIAVRVHGLFLALITLAFAFGAQQLFFEDPRISGGEGGVAIPRPSGAESVTGLYYLGVAALLLSTLLAINLRTGRTGRVLAGMRDSETACRALGIPVTRYKVLIFSLSAFVVGIAAILNGMILQSAGNRTFIPFFSLIYMTLAVLGGIFHVGGAIVSGLLFGIFPQLADRWPILNQIQFIMFGLGATLALAQNPEGLFGELRRAGNAILHIATKRGRGAREPLPVAGGQR